MIEQRSKNGKDCQQTKSMSYNMSWEFYNSTSFYLNSYGRIQIEKTQEGFEGMLFHLMLMFDLTFSI